MNSSFCNVIAVNSSRLARSGAVVACAASLVIGLAACSSDSDTSSSSTSTTTRSATSSETEASSAADTCPTQQAENGGTPEWTLPGDTGSVAVIGSTDTTAPLIDVTTPFGVTETQVHTLTAGSGPIVADDATVSVCYMGVNGRDGSVFDSSYERGAPVDFPLNGVVPGFQKAIAGQTVGSKVAVAMASADGYPEGRPSAGIEQGDSLIFAIEIISAK